MSEFKPYADESTSVEVAGFTLENQTDRIALYGQNTLTRDQAGLADARALQAVLASIVAALEAESLPAHIENQPTETVDNPFT